MSKDNHSFKIELPWFDMHYKWASVIVVVVSTALYCWLNRPIDSDKVLTFMAVLSGVMAAIFTAVYAAKGYQANKERVNLDRKQKAFDIASRWGSSDMKDTRKKFRQAIDKMGDVGGEDLIKELKKYDLELSNIFEFFEEIASAIDNDLADDKVLYDQLCSAVVNNFDRFGIWISQAQKTQSTAYCQGQSLALKWKAQMNEEKNNS